MTRAAYALRAVNSTNAAPAIASIRASPRMTTLPPWNEGRHVTRTTQEFCFVAFAGTEAGLSLSWAWGLEGEAVQAIVVELM